MHGVPKCLDTSAAALVAEQGHTPYGDVSQCWEFRNVKTPPRVYQEIQKTGFCHNADPNAISKPKAHDLSCRSRAMVTCPSIKDEHHSSGAPGRAPASPICRSGNDAETTTSSRGVTRNHMFSCTKKPTQSSSNGFDRLMGWKL